MQLRRTGPQGVESKRGHPARLLFSVIGATMAITYMYHRLHTAHAHGRSLSLRYEAVVTHAGFVARPSSSQSPAPRLLVLEPSSTPSAMPSSSPLLPTPESAAPMCPSSTELHPAVQEALGKGVYGQPHAASSASAVSAVTHHFDMLQYWGLHPLPHSPLANDAADVSNVPWRGSSVDVRTDHREGHQQPLPRGYARRARTDHDVTWRAQFHLGCIMMPGPRGRAVDVASGGMYDRFFPQDGGAAGSLIRDRMAVMAHGFGLHAALRQHLKDSLSIVKQMARYEGSEYPTASAPFYPGPWIEDHWLATFDRPVVRRMARAEYEPLASLEGVKLIADYVDSVEVQLPYDSELFHPWTPLFFPWENFMHLLMRVPGDDAFKRAEICSLMGALQHYMQPLSYQYVTVTQRPTGPFLLPFNPSDECSVKLFQVLASTVVISAGGTGHVPIPLLGQEMPFLQCSAGPSPDHSNHSIAFVGSFGNGHTRVVAGAVVHKAMAAKQAQPVLMLNKDEILQAVSPPHPDTELLSGWGLSPSTVGSPDLLWMRAQAGAAYTLAPRGAGPTSFRLYEALQMGLAPIYVYDGAPWLPYLKRGQSLTWVAGLPEDEQSLWARIAHVTPIGLLAGRLDDLFPGDTEGKREAQQKHKAMRLAAAAVRDRYFTYDGVVRRIAEFLDDPFTAELDCMGSSFV